MNGFLRRLTLGAVLAAILGAQLATQAEAPLRVAIAGLTHTHVHWLLGRPDRGDVKLVGVAESNRELADRYFKQHRLDAGLLHPDLQSMIEAVRPDAVCAFGTIREHLEVVRVCAPRGIHVMVEKPLAVSLAHAEEMAALARQHDILLLTNYETSWYPSTQEALRRVTAANGIGELLKLVVNSGHPGPEEIGVNREFLEWLTDPVDNGAGALTDFGCYGANLATAFMGGTAPESVWAVTRQLKPERYPKVDDDATIVLAYPRAQVIIQASWNWPVSRKDMELYGADGQIIAPNAGTLHVWNRDVREPERLTPSRPAPPHDDPFAYLAAAVHGKVDASQGLSSLENNLVVMRILDAAMKSARTGDKVVLD
ncbi:MAG TPA: oxidoreductase [Verrucomicrobiales bacterium]|nr:oxidoreductase [Verrucomicrobiales bacterium]